MYPETRGPRPVPAPSGPTRAEQVLFHGAVMLELRGDVKQNSTTYVYRRVYDAFKRLIVEGQLVAGDKLPTHAQIAEFLHVNSGTVRRAMGRLADEGLLVGIPSQGTFIL